MNINSIPTHRYVLNDKDLNEMNSIERSRSWAGSVDKLLRKWKHQVNIKSKGHYEISNSYKRYHYLFGIPASMISSVVTTGIFASFYDNELQYIDPATNCTITLNNSSYMPWVRLGIAIGSGIGVMLVAAMTFINYQEVAEEHKVAMAEYESLYKYIESIIGLPINMRDDPIDVLKNIREKYDNIVKVSPTLPNKYNTDLSFTFVNETNTNNMNNKNNDNKNTKDKNTKDKNTIKNRNKNKDKISIPTITPEDVKPSNLRDTQDVINDINMLDKIIDDSTSPRAGKTINNNDVAINMTSAISDITKSTTENKDEEIKSVKHKKKKKKRIKYNENTHNENVNENIDTIIDFKNGFESSDEEKEVCLGFDLDQMIALNNERQAQESLLKSLAFEIKRLENSTVEINKNRGNASDRSTRKSHANINKKNYV